MATLVSPGADISFINESFYNSAGAGTVPLIVLATAANKLTPSGLDVAEATLATSAGKLFRVTSQREVIQNLGNPKFYTSGGTALHGHELNEYGAHALYSYLGIANDGFFLRADIDLAQLESSDTAPRGDALPGTYWLDLSATRFGLFQSNGDASAGLAWETAELLVTTVDDIDGSNLPGSSYGDNGDFAIVPQTTSNFIYEKTAGTWNRVGSTAWKTAHPTVLTAGIGTFPIASGSTLIINGTTITAGGGGWTNLAAMVAAITGITNITASSVSGKLVLTNTAGLNIAVTGGTGLTAAGLTVQTVPGVSAPITNNAQYPAGTAAGSVWVKLASPNLGASWALKRFDGIQWSAVSVPFFAFTSGSADTDVSKDAAARAALALTTGVVYGAYDSAQGVMQLRRYDGTKFVALSYEASTVAPTTGPEDGTLWFNSDFRADIMVGNGTHWKGYLTYYPNTDPEGVQISGSAPTTQSDGTALVSNDLWLNSSDLENYPALYRYDASVGRWKLIDNTDQTTPFGVVFADARADSGKTFTGIPNTGSYDFNSELAEDLLVSDYLDPDAPDPRLFPDGVLLFNTRYSNYNVKVWRPEYFQDGNFDANTDYTTETYSVGDSSYVFPATTAGRWVTASGNKIDGSPYMGRKAQRIMVVRAMAEAIASNEDIRSEAVYYNLIAAPGYPELVDELVTLNTDQKEVAFIVGDTPARLQPKGIAIQQWATNAKSASSNGEDGLTTANTFVGLYYPWALGTNVDGTNVMIPPSTVALRTIAYSDQVAYPWLAPAGFQRGIVTNADSVGYLTAEGEYKPVTLNQGQRDILQTYNINPIAFMNNGLVLYGQKTLDPTDSALDRINVARLVNYLRVQLDKLVKPFLFQPNDAQTRDGARLAVERLLAGLVGLRALEDFAVLCDLSNNTSERRNRNELWIDIAIKPLKAVEFIYVPVRIRDSGASLDF